MSDFAVVVPWIDVAQVEQWCTAWQVDRMPDWLLLVEDEHRQGCAATKNRGIRQAVELGADVVVVLDDDCFPVNGTLEQHAVAHVAALEPQPVELFTTVTDPPSRGTPYTSTSTVLPVAASMGFWTGIGDYDAARQLAYNGAPMTFHRQVIFGRYFPLCGMNLAFRPRDWDPWWQFVDVPRFDDIWQGWLWQRHAWSRPACFNLNGPDVRHVRQSNPWRNLKVEARHAETNEYLWQLIARHHDPSYDALRALLPSDAGGSDR